MIGNGKYWQATGNWELGTERRDWMEDQTTQNTTMMLIWERRWILTRNLRFCFQWLPWALVVMWASVTMRISSHSSCDGSGLSHTIFCSSSRFRRSRFSSISFRLARRLLSSSTTEGKERWIDRLFYMVLKRQG